jgi:hypothetical protein
MNNRRLAQAVTNTVDKISQRGVHVIKKHKDQYQVLDIVKGQASMKNLPTYEAAHAVATALNRGRVVNQKRLHHLVASYNKWHNDCVFYQHALRENTTEYHDTLLFRLELSLGRLEQINEQLRCL